MKYKVLVKLIEWMFRIGGKSEEWEDELLERIVKKVLSGGDYF